RIEAFHGDGCGVGRIKQGGDPDRHGGGGLTARRDDIQGRRLNARQRAYLDVVEGVDQSVANPFERDIVVRKASLFDVAQIGPAADLHLRSVDEHRNRRRTDALEVGRLRFDAHIEVARRQCIGRIAPVNAHSPVEDLNLTVVAEQNSRAVRGVHNTPLAGRAKNHGRPVVAVAARIVRAGIYLKLDREFAPLGEVVVWRDPDKIHDVQREFARSVGRVYLRKVVQQAPGHGIGALGVTQHSHRAAVLPAETVFKIYVGTQRRNIEVVLEQNLRHAGARTDSGQNRVDYAGALGIG